jgi:peptidoglycan/LPS O-acetylase OafA/YrhL
VIFAAAGTQWWCPAFLKPLRLLGQRSYEVYLTHMFVLFVFLHVFLALNSPMWLVPFYFLLSIIVATLLGDLVARFYSDPVNAALRQRWGEGKLGSALAAASGQPPEAELPAAK